MGKRHFGRNLNKSSTRFGDFDSNVPKIVLQASCKQLIQKKLSANKKRELSFLALKWTCSTGPFDQVRWRVAHVYQEGSWEAFLVTMCDMRPIPVHNFYLKKLRAHKKIEKS
jgi:hypothetical protein